jgi:hypothetical protein
MKVEILILFLNFLIISSDLYSQDSIQFKTDKIEALIIKISENEKNLNEYNHLHTDGEIATKKRILGIFKHTVSKGGFAETYLLKDSTLVCLTIGSREYLIKDKNQSINKVEKFIYDNESLCFYSEAKYLEYKGKQDSLIYQIDYYFDNLTLIKVNKKGSFKLGDKLYSNQIIKKSKDKIEDKNMMNK